jgi:hypothetical protein
MREAMERWTAFDAEAAEKGALIACEPLEPSPAATTLHLRGEDEPLFHDGPFAETKERVGGFCLLDCASRDEAIRWARRVPMAVGGIEVRPVMDLSAFGYRSRTLTPASAEVTARRSEPR